jgi:hypothetical protein
VESALKVKQQQLQIRAPNRQKIESVELGLFVVLVRMKGVKVGDALDVQHIKFPVDDKSEEPVMDTLDDFAETTIGRQMAAREPGRMACRWACDL